MEPDQKIINQITDALKVIVSSHYGPEAYLVDAAPIRSDREWSTFLEYQVFNPDSPKGEITVIVKIPRGEGMTSLADVIASDDLGEYARNETAGLQKIEQAVRAAGIEGLAAIKTLGTLPTWGAVVMEHLAFQPLKSIYLYQRRFLLMRCPAPDFLEQVFQVGAWLRAFHDAGKRPDPSQLGSLDVWDQADAYLASLSVQAVGKKNSQLLRGRIKSRYESIQGKSVPVAELHEDFHFSNVFITEAGEVGGFDPAVGNPGPIYQDLSHFISDPQLWWQQVVTGGFLMPRRCHAKIRAAFLEGYGGEIEFEILDFFCALQVVRRWQILAERVQSSGKLGPQGMKDLILRFVRGYYLRLLGEYLS